LKLAANKIAYKCTLKMTNMKTNGLENKKLIFCFFIIQIFQILCLAETNAQYTGIDESIAKYRKGELVIKAKPGDKVIIEQLTHEFWFGCAISNSIIGNSMPETDNRQYKEKFLENFNSAVTENALKWGNMERQKGEVNYAVVDGILKWTEENHIPLRGHNLFWGIPQFIQPWVKELNDEELRQTLQNRAETITSRYKGRFAEYDLNNEMIHGNYYEDRLGPDITKLMAQWAHNGDPGAKLFLNDYDILTGIKLPDYMTQIRKLLKQGVPIAGIGAQGHLHGETFDRNQLKNSLDSLAVFKLPIRITEFNLPGQRSKYYKDRNLVMTPQEEELKAKEIVDYYKICFAHPAVEGIMMWGFWEGANWIPVSSLYKRDWSPTPAAKAYQNLLFNEWWTKVSGTVGKDGNFSTPAFFGNYKVTVNSISKEISLTKEKGKTVVDFSK
jgi:endo-1,4-beta-xylanase